jgi:tripartite-type tricarboxylate transporter receptor subunit TctC
VERIYRDSKKILEEPEFRLKQLVEKGYDPVGSAPAEFVIYLKKDREARGRAVRISGAKAV